MADTIECPFCCNQADLRAGCRGCNGAGFIGCHDAPEPAERAALARPCGDTQPPPFVHLVSHGIYLYALDNGGELWRVKPENLIPEWRRVKWDRRP